MCSSSATRLMDGTCPGPCDEIRFRLTTKRHSSKKRWFTYCRTPGLPSGPTPEHQSQIEPNVIDMQIARKAPGSLTRACQMVFESACNAVGIPFLHPVFLSRAALAVLTLVSACE